MNKISQTPVAADQKIGISEANFTHVDAALDEALKQSFPASDPIAVSFPGPVAYCPELDASPAIDRK